MKRFALFIAMIPLAAFAAPVPKPDHQTLPGFGEILDPVNDCKFQLEHGKLIIIVPGKGRDIDIEKGDMKAPRVLNNFSGNFVMDVTVVGARPSKDAKSLMPPWPPYFSAGLHVAEDDKNYIRFEKVWMDASNSLCYVNYELYVDGRRKTLDAAHNTQVDPEKPTRLRITRNETTFSSQYSQDDGKTWKTAAFKDVKLGDKLRVGVAAVNTTDTEFKPTFSDFKLEKSDPKAKP